ncbi:MAG: site-2 protease family protein [Mycobacteriales bacterium]
MHERGADGAGARGAAAHGLPIGRPFGIPVYLSPSWLLVAAFITVSVAADATRVVPTIGAGAYVVGLAVAVLLAASVLAHELGHSVVSLALGIPIRRITLFLLGGYASMDREPDTPAKELLVAVAGPLVSVLVAGAGWAAYAHVAAHSATGIVIGSLALSNTLIAGFNLLPGLPLDGGRVARALVWHVTGNELTATRFAYRGGQVIASLVTALGVIGLVNGDYSGIYLLLVGSFLWSNGRLGLRHAEFRSRLPTLRARSLARRALNVAADLPLAEALRRADSAGRLLILPVDSYGKPSGLVSAAAVRAVPEHRRPWLSVSALSRPLEPGLVLPADLAGEELLAALRATPAGEYLVTDDAGVVGVLEMSEVVRRMDPRHAAAPS